MLKRWVHIQEDEVGKGNILVSLRGIKIKSSLERNFMEKRNHPKYSSAKNQCTNKQLP